MDFAATTTPYQFSPDRDTWIGELLPTLNYGADNELKVRNTVGDSYRSFYHFDLSTIPAGNRVATATAWFYVTANDSLGGLKIHPVSTAWTELGATWDNMGTAFDSGVSMALARQYNSGVWVSANLTALAQSWVNDSSTNHSIVLLAISNGIESKYSSPGILQPGYKPYLKVTTAVGDVSPVSITATGTLSDGLTRTITRSDVKVFQTPATIIFQPGAALEDAWTSDDAAGANDRNFGISSILSVQRQ